MKAKNILVLLLAITLAIFSFSACSASNNEDNNAQQNSSSNQEAPSAVYNTRTGIVLNVLVQDGDETGAAAGKAISSILTKLGYTSQTVTTQDILTSSDEGKEALALVTNDLAAEFKISGYLALAKLAPNCILVASSELVTSEIAFDILNGMSDNISSITSAHETMSEFSMANAENEVIIPLHDGAKEYYSSLDEVQ